MIRTTGKDHRASLHGASLYMASLRGIISSCGISSWGISSSDHLIVGSSLHGGIAAWDYLSMGHLFMGSPHHGSSPLVVDALLRILGSAWTCFLGSIFLYCRCPSFSTAAVHLSLLLLSIVFYCRCTSLYNVKLLHIEK